MRGRAAHGVRERLQKDLLKGRVCGRGMARRIEQAAGIGTSGPVRRCFSTCELCAVTRWETGCDAAVDALTSQVYASTATYRFCRALTSQVQSTYGGGGDASSYRGAPTQGEAQDHAQSFKAWRTPSQARPVH
jgi:hypothetical protein